jgi:selenocysteine lyase/cysteine desulfurase
MDNYKEEQFWEEQDKRLFPHKEYVDFGSASFGLPMELQTAGIQLLCKGERAQAVETLKEENEYARRLAAELLNTSPDHIYFDINTVNAMSNILRYIGRSDKREILTTTDEIIDISKVLMNSAKKVAALGVNGIGKELRGRFNPQTKAVAVSYVTHATCKVVQIKEISDLARKYEVPFIVDAAQAFGHIPVDVNEIGADFIIGSGHKWLRGAIDGYSGSAIVYSKRSLGELYKDVWPPVEGAWVDDEYVAPYTGSKDIGNMDKIAHLGACLAEYKQLGWKNVHTRTQYLGVIARSELSKVKNITVLSSTAPGSIPIKAEDSKSLCEKLGENGIRTTYKPAESLVRVSISAFNTTKEIQQLRETLEKIVKP